MNELEILRRLPDLLPQNCGVLTGPGDDCAVLDFGGRVLLAAVDQLIGDRHYLRSVTEPAAAGAKLMKRNLSDIAAMGGVPRWALLTVAANGREAEWILKLIQGAAEAGHRYEVAVVGGDTASLASEGECCTLTILGEMPGNQKAVLRSGAQPGDLLVVTGVIGNSFASGHHLTFEPRLAEGAFLCAGGYASAMLDISDGLLLDALRLAEASTVSVLLEKEAVPLRDGATRENALSDGEDYELLFTVPPERFEKLMNCWPVRFAPLTRIGLVTAGLPGVYDRTGASLTKGVKIGYEH